MGTNVLEVKGVDKGFFGVQVLHAINFDVRPGEVHVLLGENGAGKSTLMKILSGVYSMDAGEIYISGKKVSIKEPHHALQLGIGMVYQELSTARNVSVMENIYLGNLPTKFRVFVDKKKAIEKAKEIFKDLDINIDVEKSASSYELGIQQLIEIMRVLSQNAKLVILDEPTSSLSNTEVKKLFEAIHVFKGKGISFIYITHKLDEVYQVGDRITVLRDGCKIGETIEDISTVSQEELISMVVGRKLENRYPKTPAMTDEVLMEVKGLSDGKYFNKISFKLHKGEVLGISGLVGAGSSEMLEAIYGMRGITSGSITLNGNPFIPISPNNSIKKRIGFLTKDRSGGLLTHMSVSDNIVVSNFTAFSRKGFRLKKKETLKAQEYVKLLNIATESIKKKVRLLSGGNQQKVAIAKWICNGTIIYLMDDPTRGVDVGSKVEVYHLINKMTAEGAGIIMISSDMPELLGISDTIAVMRAGEIVAHELAGKLTQEYILEKVAGGET